MENSTLNQDQKKLVTMQKLLKNKLENECPCCGSNLFEIIKETSVKGRFDKISFSKPKMVALRLNCASCYMNLIDIDEFGHVELSPLA